MKGKALFIVVVVAIALLAYVYTKPQPIVLSVNRVYGVTEVGQSVLVNVSISNIPEMGGIMTDLTWDPYYLQLAIGSPNSTRGADGSGPWDLFEGPFLREKGVTTFVINTASNSIGSAIVTSALSAGSAVSGSGILLIANFTVVRLGTSSVELRPPARSLNQSLVADSQVHTVDHLEESGLVTDRDSPPVYMTPEFQSNLLGGEVIALAAITAVVYWRTSLRVSKLMRRKAELQPIVSPEDQSETQ